jgi:HEAT repeat protein
VEPILSALDKLDSDFMQDNVLDTLEHIAPEAAFDDVQSLAQRREPQAVRILGRIGDESACGALHNFLGGGDTNLETTTLRALGMIGSDESTEPVAEALANESPEVRSAAARALGLIGDTRAVAPLTETLATDEANEVRASAAWALTQIRTARALETAAEYTDDRSYLVQVEAERAASLLDTPKATPS